MPCDAARVRLVAVFAAVLAAGAPAATQQPAPPSAQSAAAPGTPTLSFDMLVLDRDGREPERLSPADITVTVDGRPRRVTAVRRVSRGPGAVADAATRRSREGAAMMFAAEPIRNVLVVVDQASLVRGDERAAIAASQALLDRVGVADRLAVVLLPMPQDQMLSLATEQPVARETLAKAAGRIDPATLVRADLSAFPPAGNPMISDPERLREAEPVAAPTPVPTMAESDAAPVAGPLHELAGLLDAIRTVPGRKIVALFSAGMANTQAAQISAVAAAAVSARAAIYAFVLPGPREESGAGLQVAPLESLARSTGGTFVTAGRNPDRVLARTASELAWCYVVELEPARSDADNRRHALRVSVAGRGLNVRAPAWLVASADPGDLPAAAPVAVPAGAERAGAAGTARADASRAPAPPEDPPSAREAELQVTLARVVDYVEAYERQYSGLVAEEEYRQATRGKNARLKSDYLLVKPDQSSQWISFRDVYEVDGVAVRDRDDRLRRLFLDPGVGISVQLQAIRDESARYNLGLVERNINVPLFLLQFLRDENRPRSRFKLGARREVDGHRTVRLEFEERVRPTIITDIQGRDVAAKGWFLVDETTGAIVETVLKIEENGSTGEIRVAFRHDPALGMWVPAEMSELYQALTQRSLSGAPRAETLVEGTAKYTKFRRFQVKTEEKLVIPK
jgi:VWFA-related protein